MTLTSTEVAEMLGWSTAHARYTQVVALLPSVTYSIDEYTKGAFSRQVKEQAVTFSAAGSSASTDLGHEYVIRGSVMVSSTNRAYTYYGDCMNTRLPNPRARIPSTEIEEYAVDYENGEIWAASTEGRLIPSTNGLVTYSYVDLVEGGKVAAAKLIQQQVAQTAGVGSESVGSLSRSYVGNGMDPAIKALLRPYCRIGWA